MDKVKCELCPIQDYCPSRKEREADLDATYHHEDIVRVYVKDCPLIRLIRPNDRIVE